jgi:hypothetical protein
MARASDAAASGVRVCWMVLRSALIAAARCSSIDQRNLISPAGRLARERKRERERERERERDLARRRVEKGRLGSERRREAEVSRVETAKEGRSQKREGG